MKLLTKNDSYIFLGDLLYNAKAKDIENDIKQLIPQKQKLQNGNNSSVDDPSSLSSSSSNHNSEFPLVIWNGQQQKFLIVDIGQGNDIDMFMYTHDFGNVHTS